MTVEDSGNPPLKFEKSLSVNITNVNEAPTDITLSNNKVTGLLSYSQLSL